MACFEIEREVIAHHGLDKLTNILAGGDGMSSEEAFRHGQKLRARNHLTKHHPDLIDPFGFVYPKISNLAEFCEEFDLWYQPMQELVTGKRKHCKGWRIYTPGTLAVSWLYENTCECENQNYLRGTLENSA